MLEQNQSFEELHASAAAVTTQWSVDEIDLTDDSASAAWARYVQSRLQHFSSWTSPGGKPATDLRYAKFARG